jgi:DNA (cytosine-5)-methyltransferase 1
MALRGPNTSNTTRAGLGVGKQGDPAFTLQAAHSHAIAFIQNQAGDVLTGNVASAMGTNSNATGRNTPKVHQGMQVRRLTPVECERLQGFPDNHTRIPWRNKPAEDCPDGPRYKALGNSMAVPCMRWIGERIAKTNPETL